MPASTNASYVGRLAPPGRPNTTSTPSALRHSITASTARMRFPLSRSVRSWDTTSREGRLARQCSPNRRANGEPGSGQASETPARRITGSFALSGAQRGALRPDDDQGDCAQRDEHRDDGRDQGNRVGVAVGRDDDAGLAGVQAGEVAVDGGAVGRLELVAD